VNRWFGELLGNLRAGPLPPEPAVPVERSAKREGVAVPADVAFVAVAFPSIGLAHPDAPALQVLGLQLGLDYLWNEIRVKGGAYGAHAGFNALNAVFTLSSYRDPHVRETLEAYAGIRGYLESRMDLSPAAVEQAIIGTVKTLDRPVRPGHAVGLALGRFLNGETPEFRKRYRQSLLSLQGETIRRVGLERIAASLSGAPVCVVASREKLEAENKTLGAGKLEISDLF
jgi:presequence protease